MAESVALNLLGLLYDVAKDLYKYLDGYRNRPKDIERLLNRSQKLQNFCLAIQKSLRKPGISVQELELINETLQQNEQTMTELRDSLNTLVTPVSSSNHAVTKWRIRRGARFLLPFQSGKLLKLEKHLNICLGHLQICIDHLNLNIGAGTSGKVDNLEQKSGQRLDQLGTDIDQLSKAQNLNKDCLLNELQLQSLEARETYSSTLGRVETTFADQIRLQEKGLKRTEQLAQQDKILESLSFIEQSMRRQAVDEAHADTFRWIFDEQRSHFASWLKHETGIFWVRGKAGSGKSTLMKFISDNECTFQYLRQWAEGKEIVIIEHFFWVAGTLLQKSQLGLLRSLLRQILVSDPEIIPIVCAERLRSSYSISREWNKSELFTTLRLAIDTSKKRFCFLVDGLDEYEPVREHDSLIDFLEQLSKSACVKIIVSSRPWNVFERRLANQNNQLRLEDLTQGDILNYTCARLRALSWNQLDSSINWSEIRSTLSRDQSSGIFNWSGFLSTESEKYLCLPAGRDISIEFARHLVYKIVRKADGVFLWVSIVLDEICREVDAQRPLDILLKYVDEFPAQLEQYFRNLIYQRNDTGRNKESAILFWIMSQPHWTGHLGSLAFRISWMICTYGAGIFDKKEFYKMDGLANRPLKSYEEVQSTVEPFVNTCCKDLLAVQFTPVLEVGVAFVRYPFLEFNHRTIFDFIATHEIQQIIMSRIPSHFYEPDCQPKLIVLALKSLMSTGTRGSGFEMLRHCRSICHSIVENSELNGRHFLKNEDMADIVEEFGKVFLELFGTKIRYTGLIDISEIDLALDLLIMYGQYSMVTQILCHYGESLKPSIGKPRRILDLSSLLHVLGFDFNCGRFVVDPDVRLLRLLLEFGESPNGNKQPHRPVRYMSPWAVSVSELIDEQGNFRDVSGPRIESLCAMIECGADLSEPIPVQYTSSRKTGQNTAFMILKAFAESGEWPELVECLDYYGKLDTGMQKRLKRHRLLVDSFKMSRNTSSMGSTYQHDDHGTHAI